MAKLSKEDLVKKISEKVTDEDVAIELMEDVSDSLDVSEDTEKEEMKAKIDELESKNAELKTKYKERFLSGEEKEEVIEKVNDEEKEDEEEKEEVIDVKEI